jgi:hypothetical protein
MVNNQYNTLHKVISGHSEANYKEFYEYNKNLINKHIAAFKEHKELFRIKMLLKNYLDHMEAHLTEDNQDYTDFNDIRLGSLIKSLEFVNTKIEENKQYIRDDISLMNNYDNLSILKDISETCLKTDYKFYKCEMCFKRFTCSGYKKHNKYKNIDLG